MLYWTKLHSWEVLHTSMTESGVAHQLLTKFGMPSTDWSVTYVIGQLVAWLRHRLAWLGNVTRIEHASKCTMMIEIRQLSKPEIRTAVKAKIDHTSKRYAREKTRAKFGKRIKTRCNASMLRPRVQRHVNVRDLDRSQQKCKYRRQTKWK